MKAESEYESEDEMFPSIANNWKHWLVYSTCIFLTIFVLVEFALSLALFSIVAPSNFMFYFTPVGLIFGESIGSFFASVLLFVGLFVILRLKVYVKTEQGLKFNRSDAHLLLPFYLVAIVSLAIYISFIPLEISNLMTYVVFVIVFESFIEHFQVSGYGQWFKGLTEKEEHEMIEEKEEKEEKETGMELTETEVTRIDEELEGKTVKEEKKEREVKGEEDISIVDEIEGLVEELDESTPEEVSVDEEKVEGPEVTLGEPVKVQKRVKKVKKTVEERTKTCPICGYEEKKGAEICSQCGEPLKEAEEESEDLFSDLLEDIDEGSEEMEPAETEGFLDELEKELSEEAEEEMEEDEEVSLEEIEKELDEELRSIEEKTGIETEPVEKTEGSIECPLCGAEFDATEGRCPECGEPVEEEEEDDFFSDFF